MSFLDKTHGGFVYPRRVAKLARKIASLLPTNAQVLDVGCGDGILSREIAKLRTDVRVSGIDVLIRERPLIPVSKFDGTTIPYPNASFDVVMLIDVLHHTNDPTVLLRESKRVARQAIVIKDHTRNGPLAAQRLRFMDWVGNARHGVVLPYNYWRRERWREELAKLHLKTEYWLDDLNLYPWWANWMFGRSLQFIASIRS
jgi:SAM-dependent methyltransferase